MTSVGPDTGKHLRNIAIVIVLAVVVWKVPGGGTASLAISNLLGLIFIGGLLLLAAIVTAVIIVIWSAGGFGGEGTEGLGPSF